MVKHLLSSNLISDFKVNNSDFFGKSMYSDVAPENASWLVSNGQYNAKTVYTDYYNWLVEHMNNGVEGVLNSVMYAYSPSGSGIIFTLTTTNPKVGMTCYGWSDGSYNNIPLSTITSVNQDGTFVAAFEGTDYTFERNSAKDQSQSYPTDYDWIVNTSDETFRLPLVADRVLVAKKEAKAEDKAWYNLYSDGWIEQGGIIANTGTNHVETISLLKPYVDTNYVVTVGHANSAGAISVANSGQIGNKTTSSFQSYQYHDIIINWCACGYGEVPASSEYTEIQGLYFYVGDTVQDASLINAGAVLGQLANKTNFVEAAAASMPSKRLINLTLGASGSSYTAPANGWFMCVFICGNTGGYINAYIDRGLGFMDDIAASQAKKFYLPVLKGDKMYFLYPSANTSSSDWCFGFIYAEGEN